MLNYNMKYTSQTYTFLYYEKNKCKNNIKTYSLISKLLNK